MTVKAIAHRGAHREMPENSLSSFKQAIKNNADGIELDVRLCGSDDVIIFHDPWLKRMMGISGNVRRLNLDELKRVSYLNHPNEFIITLPEMLEEIGGKLLINIEIKDVNLLNHQLVKKVVKIVNEFKLKDSIWISSFNPMVIDVVKLVDSSIRTGFLFNKVRYLPLLLGSFMNFDAWHPNYALVDENLMSVAKKRGKEVYSWTVNKQSEIDRLVHLGIDGIITDDTSLITKQIA